MLWKEKGEQDAAVPLVGVQDVELIRIDGSRSTLQAGGREITLTVSSDPVLLLYNGGSATLPESLAVPQAKWVSAPQVVSRREIPFRWTSRIEGDSRSATPQLIAPPFWKVMDSRKLNRDGMTVFRYALTPPAASRVREVDLVLALSDSQGQKRGILNHRFQMAE